MRDEPIPHVILLFLLAIITVNIFFLDLAVFSPVAKERSSIQTSTAPSTPTPISFSFLTPSLTIVTTPSPTITLMSSNTQPVTTARESVGARKEIYVPLGSGVSKKSAWEDIIGTETLIDSSLYGSIEGATFIASLRNPTQNGQVYAQLYNATDKHPVWGSQVVLEGRESQTLTSSPIAIETGTKLYRVQLKSTLSYQVFLDNAKIRVVSRY